KEMEYKGFKVIVAQNELYKKALDYLDVPHLLNEQYRFKEKTIKTKIGARTKKEQRFLRIVRIIEKHYDLPEETFELANLEKSFVFDETEYKLDGKVLGVKVGDKIYLDRRYIDFTSYRVQNFESDNLGVHDYKILMRALKTIAHELAHLLYHTQDNTQFHNQMEDVIYKEIASLF
ncbi:MAG: ImmA/IrrE family metallo-endopeptidase, partial [bacterium]